MYFLRKKFRVLEDIRVNYFHETSELRAPFSEYFPILQSMESITLLFLFRKYRLVFFINNRSAAEL